MQAVGLGCASSQKVLSHLGLYTFSVNAAFCPWHWSISRMASNQRISRSVLLSEPGRENLALAVTVRSGGINVAFGCFPLSRSCSLHLACPSEREMGELRANAMLRSSPQTSALCSRGSIILLECSAVSWFLGQIAESLTIHLFLLVLGKKCYPPVPSFSLFAVTVWRSIIKTLKELL